MKQAILFVFAICAVIFCQAESLFWLKFHYGENEGREDYDCLFVRRDNGTGFVRINFLEDGVNRLIECNTDEQYKTLDNGDFDYDTLYVVCNEPVYITGSGEFTPDIFVFAKGEDDYYLPAFVVSLDDNSEPIAGVFDDAIPIESDAFTPEFAASYFLQSEEYYQNLFGVSTRLPERPSVTLHLLLLAATDDLKIGKTCEVDKRGMVSTMEAVAENLKIKFNPQVLEGKMVTKKNLQQKLSDLRPGRDDIVVFYYSGHGYNFLNGNSDFPEMDLRPNPALPLGAANAMNVEDVFKGIVSKGARLNLVISDCCNFDPGASMMMNGEVASTRPVSLGWNLDLTKKLFLDSRVNLMMTAARKGELSAGNVSQGGFFTFMFRENMESSFSKMAKAADAEWIKIFNDSKKETTARANRSECRLPDETTRRCQQTPVMKIQ